MIKDMADYTSIESAINDRLTSGAVVEYEIGSGKRRVKYDTGKDALMNSARAAGLASRQSGGMLKVAKLQEPSE